MKRHSLELQHIDHYMEKGYILFKDLLSCSKVREVKESALFLGLKNQRNSWKLSELIKKQALHISLSSIASSLVRLKTLRFGFDHYFHDTESLKEFFNHSTTLSQLSSIDGLEIALIINLSQETESDSLFPSCQGSGMFFNPKKPLDLTGIELAQGPFLLIAYCKSGARYIFQPLDPFTHEEKKEGIEFGDILSSKLHPFVHF